MNEESCFTALNECEYKPIISSRRCEINQNLHFCWKCLLLANLDRSSLKDMSQSTLPCSTSVCSKTELWKTSLACFRSVRVHSWFLFLSTVHHDSMFIPGKTLLRTNGRSPLVDGEIGEQRFVSMETVVTKLPGRTLPRGTNALVGVNMSTGTQDAKENQRVTKCSSERKISNSNSVKLRRNSTGSDTVSMKRFSLPEVDTRLVIFGNMVFKLKYKMRWATYLYHQCAFADCFGKTDTINGTYCTPVRACWFFD